MPQDFTVDRASKKYVLGSDGFLKEYTTDQPAIEFNPDGSYKGVLVEPQSVNLIEDSTEIGDLVYWSQLDGVTVALNDAESPNGNTNATEVTLTGADGNVNILPTVASGEIYTASCFFKKGTSNVAYIQCNSSPFNNGQATFNLDTKSISLGNWTSGDYQELGNGWYRFWVTDTSTSSGAVRIRFGLNGTSGQTMYMFGAQFEQSPIATSYIPTTTGAVTRVKDDIYLTSASSLIGQTEGTLFVEVDWRFVDGQNQRLLLLSDGTADNRLLIYSRNSPQELRMFVLSNNVESTNQGVSSTALTGIQKIAFAYKQNDAELYRNGSSVSTDTTVDLTSLATLTDVDFGQSVSSVSQANMWIRAVALYTSRLTDTECEDLTTL